MHLAGVAEAGPEHNLTSKWSNNYTTGYCNLREGNNVVAAQQMLHMLGYDTGGVDNYFGSRTNSATVAMQRRFGISADGCIGPITWSALQRYEHDQLADARPGATNRHPTVEYSYVYYCGSQICARSAFFDYSKSVGDNACLFSVWPSGSAVRSPVSAALFYPFKRSGTALSTWGPQNHVICAAP